MSRSRSHFEEFQPHTKHKHLILQHYFLAWGHKLGLRTGAGDSILYVDACAGRGSDDVGNQGSPLIAAVAAATAQSSVSSRRGEVFRIQVVAVESKRSYYKVLAELLAPFAAHVRVLEGTLADHLKALDEEFATVPALYFIDPFGLEPLDAEVVKAILSGERHEALILFADQAALRHFGAISAQETRAERRHRAAMVPLPLFPEMAPADVDQLGDAAAESRAQLATTREHAIRIMNAAFGDPGWLVEIETVPRENRREAFLALYSRRLRSWGTHYVLHIPVVDVSGTRAYTMIHASKSPKAYAAMKEAVTHALEHSPLPEAVVARMRDLIRSDLREVLSLVRKRFAREQVRWAEEPTGRRAPCVRNYVLEETATFPFELDALKAMLRPLKLPGRALVYAFPAD
jgi:three-Cys-motif partner protein